MLVVWRLNQLSSDREQQSRQRRDEAEQQHDAHVQTRARHLVAPGAPETDRLHPDHRHHGDHQHQIDEQHAEHDLVARHDRRQPGQDQVGGKARDQRQPHDHRADQESPAGCSRQAWAALLQQRIDRRLRVEVGELAQALDATCHNGSSLTAYIPQCGDGRALQLGCSFHQRVRAHGDRGSHAAKRSHTSTDSVAFSRQHWVNHSTGERQVTPATRRPHPC
jgi:hypothetical protein